jgi:ribosomal protein L11 methyltransferase
MTRDNWTIRFENYHPIDESMEERLQRIIAEIDRIPPSALRVDEENRVVTIDYTQVRDRFESSRQVLRTVRAGKHLVVKPPWEDYEASDSDVVIEIDPGQAFGSGLHQTTSICLEALERYVKYGISVLDFGTGSGILAIAAAKLGASSVIAIDAHPAAVDAARENIRRNGLDSTIEILRADSLSNIRQGVDLIVVNIVAEVIVPQLEEFNRVLKQDCLLICSGLTDRNYKLVESALPDAGFT